MLKNLFIFSLLCLAPFSSAMNPHGNGPHKPNLCCLPTDVIKLIIVQLAQAPLDCMGWVGKADAVRAIRMLRQTCRKFRDVFALRQWLQEINGQQVGPVGHCIEFTSSGIKLYSLIDHDGGSMI